MDIVYYIIIPIITSILGGLVGGLFTYLGVKLTIKNDNEIQKQLKQEKNKEKNEEIISNRPQLEIIKSKTKDISNEISIYVLPYINPVLENDEIISFDYDNLNLEDDFWSYSEITIKNIGSRTIEAGFLQLEYKSGVNIYSEYEFNSWKIAPWDKNYYSDKQVIPGHIKPNEFFRLKMYYPKSQKNLRIIRLDCYMDDEDGNCWLQRNFNIGTGGKSIPISSDNYTLNFRDQYNMWFIYDHMFYSKDIKKKFNTIGMEKVLQERKENLWKRENENSKFRLSIKNGEKLLKS